MPLAEAVMASGGKKLWLDLCLLAFLFAQIPKGESNRLLSLPKSRNRNPLVILLNNDDRDVHSPESYNSNEGRGSQGYHNKRDNKRHDHSYERYHDQDHHDRYVQKRNDHHGQSSVYDNLLPYVDHKSLVQLKKLLEGDRQNNNDRYDDNQYHLYREHQQHKRDRQRRGDYYDRQRLRNKYDNRNRNNYRQYDRKDLDRKNDRQRYNYYNYKKYGYKNYGLKPRYDQERHQSRYRGDKHRDLNRGYYQDNVNREYYQKDYRGKAYRGQYNDDLQRNDYRGDTHRDEYRGDTQRDLYRSYAKKDDYRKPRRGRDYNHLRARLDELDKSGEENQQVQRQYQDQDHRYQSRLQALRSRISKNLQNLEKSPVKYLLRTANDLDCAAQLECIKSCGKKKKHDPPKKQQCENTCEKEIACDGDDADDYEDNCNESGNDSCGGDGPKTGSTKGEVIVDVVKDDC